MAENADWAVNRAIIRTFRLNSRPCCLQLLVVPLSQMSQGVKIPAILSGGVFLILIAFYWPFLSGQGSFFLSDATFWLEPQARYLRESVWSGRFPLWNPWNYCGMPQMAIPFPSLLYLPDWLFVLFPFNPALALSMIFHQLLALVAMYAMLRNLNFSSMASAGGAIIYSLSGYMFGLSNNHSLVAGTAWFPALFLTLSKVVSSSEEKTRLRYCFFSSLSFMMLIASGRPEVFVPAAIIASTSALGQALSRIQTKDSDKSALIWLCRSLFLGATLSMPILLPMAEWLASSRRALGLNSFEVFLYSADWFDILSAITGPCLGDLRLHGNPFRQLVSFSNLPAYIACSYIGPLAAYLAFLGITDRTWDMKKRVAILIILIVFIFASLGDTTPLAKFLVELFPTAGFIRFPVKLLFVPIWCISLLAARGIDRITIARIPNVVAILAIGILSLSAGILLQFGANHHVLYSFKYPVAGAQIMLKAQENIAFSLFISAIIILIFTLCINLFRKIPQRLSALCIVSLGAMLLTNAFQLERIYAPADHFQKPSFVAQKLSPSNSKRILNLTYERFTVPQLYQSSKMLERTIGELQYHRQILRPNTNVDANFAEAFGFEGSMNGEFFNVFYNSYFKSNQTIRPEISPTSSLPLARFASISSCEYLISQIYRINQKLENVKEFDSPGFEKVLEDERYNLRIYKNTHPLPRFFVCHNWYSPRSHNEVLNALVSVKDGWKPWEQSFIETSVSPKANIDEHDHSILLKSESPEKICFEVNSDTDAHLVTSDRNYPGWKAYIDGVETRILTANAFFKCIAIPKGKHQVIFEYFPQSLYLGIGLASLGVLLLIYLFYKTTKELTGTISDA